MVSLLDRSEVRGDCLCAEARARLSAWSVDDVCDFVNSIDICAEYASVSAHLFPIDCKTPTFKIEKILHKIYVGSSANETLSDGIVTCLLFGNSGQLLHQIRRVKGLFRKYWITDLLSCFFELLYRTSRK